MMLMMMMMMMMMMMSMAAHRPHWSGDGPPAVSAAALQGALQGYGTARLH
jgi:hypothetical protein